MNKKVLEQLDESIRIQYEESCPYQIRFLDQSLVYCAASETPCTFSDPEHEWVERYLCKHILTENLLNSQFLTPEQIQQKRVRISRDKFK